MSPRFFFTTLFSALGAAGIVIFGSDAIEANVEPTISTEAKPMPVTVERFELETGYSASTRFLGIIEAASDSNIGFEVAGVLSELRRKKATLSPRINCSDDWTYVNKALLSLWQKHKKKRLLHSLNWQS